MTDAQQDMFSNLTVSELKQYLSDRDIVFSNTLKKDLLARCRAASLLNLQPRISAQEYAQCLPNSSTTFCTNFLSFPIQLLYSTAM